MLEPDFYSGASDEQRLSCFGAWLRRTSLDELPELWNVLRGELGPVGSLPLLMQYVDRYPRSRADDTKSCPESRDGRRYMVATRPRGSSASPLTFGMSIISSSGLISKFWRLRL